MQAVDTVAHVPLRLLTLLRLPPLSCKVAFVLLEPGSYPAAARLLYSDCHGLQEPWTRADGYKDAVKKEDHCYVGVRVLMDSPALTQLTPPAPEALRAACAASQEGVAAARSGGDGSTGGGAGRVIRMEHYTVLRNHSFHTVGVCKPRLPAGALPRPVTRLLILGDSTIKQVGRVRECQPMQFFGTCGRWLIFNTAVL